jgi:GNAT superfamily N-acetyltransferase
MRDAILRPMEQQERGEIADLIYVSMNYAASATGRPPTFRGGPEATELFCSVYEELDPGHCIVAEHPRSGRLMGSCFYRERETHLSLGIMNVHPVYFGAGVGKTLLRFVCNCADAARKPLRLVSSATSLDSFSLYSHEGFVPRVVFQTILLSVPEKGVQLLNGPGDGVRPATESDVEAIAAVELAVSGIKRAKDYRYLIDNRSGDWRVLVHEDEDGTIDGYLASIGHPLVNMVGPGAARTEQQAIELLAGQLDSYRGRAPLVVVPCANRQLVDTLYKWGARNIDVGFVQVRGNHQWLQGVIFPSFLPETG